MIWNSSSHYRRVGCLSARPLVLVSCLSATELQRTISNSYPEVTEPVSTFVQSCYDSSLNAIAG